MKPEEKYMLDFQKIFSGSSIQIEYEGNRTIVFHHNVDLSKINTSDSLALDYMNATLKAEGIEHWLQYSEDD